MSSKRLNPSDRTANTAIGLVDRDAADKATPSAHALEMQAREEARARIIAAHNEAIRRRKATEAGDA